MREIRKVSIIGLGALGILFGQKLSEKIGADLTVIADEKRIEKYQKQGVFCNGKACEFFYETPEEKNCADLLLFCVKFGGLKSAIEAARNHVGENTIMISLLNGIVSEEIIGKALGEENLIWSVAQGMDTQKVDNQLYYQNPGIICFGNRNGDEPSEKVAAVQAFFERVGIGYEINNRMDRKIWSKFMLNVGINQVVAVFGEDFGSVQIPGKARALMIAAMQEVILVAQKEGVFLSEEDIAYWLKLIDSLSADGKPSLRQDVEAKRLSEVELFSGTVLELGQKHGIETPVNRILYEAIKEMEEGY